ncbi:MAG TPA: RNA-directed DNA polymerase [Streptosporangiaceae bacterium]
MSGDRDLPDIIRLEDVASEWSQFRHKIIARLASNTYSLAPVDIVDLPKDALNVRPIVRLGVEDRLIYDACVLSMTPTIDLAIPGNVYSYRWSTYKQALYSPKSRWIRMQRRGRRFSKRNNELLLLRTDITSFYEYVDIDMLMSDLRVMGLAEWALNLLELFLNEFNSSAHAWGLPQGPDSSGILSNVYLLPIDKIIQRNNLTHLRYSDDIMVFGPTWLELRKTLLQINHAFRSRHLCLAASKTEIIPADKVAAEFEDTSKDAVRYNIDIASPLAQDELHAYFDVTVGNSPISLRDLRFALNQLKRISDDYAVTWLLSQIDRFPNVARDAILYLSVFSSRRPEIDTELTSMLADRSFEFYPSVERQIMNYLVLKSVYAQKAVDACWEILEDTNKGIVRDFAARYLGKFCDRGDGSRLRELFEREGSEEVRRALLIAYFESGECPSSLLRSLSHSNSRVGIAARYLLLGPTNIPCPSLEVKW